MHEKITIVDFGSPTTQLLGRRLRQMNVYCEIVPYHSVASLDSSTKGVILSSSPYSVYDEDAFDFNFTSIRKQYPILAVGYAAQYLVKKEGGQIAVSSQRDYEERQVTLLAAEDPLLKNVDAVKSIFFQKSDGIDSLPLGFSILAQTNLKETAAYKIDGENTWGIQFIPESDKTELGEQVLNNFIDICELSRNWTPASFVESTVKSLQNQLGNDKVILALSGGVDSSVVAVLLHNAIGDNLTCIFVDHGLLRKNEFENVLNDYAHLGLNVKGIDAKARFYSALKDVEDPEEKRKIIGKSFIDVFDEEAHKLSDIKWLAQGTIYPDIIESMSLTGKVVKSHHNVGGLPEKMNLQLCEPLKFLFKDEVRRIGLELGMKKHLIMRHPFPGPGLGVRILGSITPDRVRILQNADDVFVSKLREHDLYDWIWQAGAILLPVNTVGVSNGMRTYENAVALRAVTSVDALTAQCVPLPYSFLTEVANEIIENVEGVNRVVYDVSPKPPATIEWE